MRSTYKVKSIWSRKCCSKGIVWIIAFFRSVSLVFVLYRFTVTFLSLDQRQHQKNDDSYFSGIVSKRFNRSSESWFPSLLLFLMTNTQLPISMVVMHSIYSSGNSLALFKRQPGMTTIRKCFGISSSQVLKILRVKKSKMLISKKCNWLWTYCDKLGEVIESDQHSLINCFQIVFELISCERLNEYTSSATE